MERAEKLTINEWFIASDFSYGTRKISRRGVRNLGKLSLEIIIFSKIILALFRIF
jgi:hypothetical protein